MYVARTCALSCAGMGVDIGWMENHGLVTRIESTTRRFEPMFRRMSESDLDDPTGIEPKLSEVLESESEEVGALNVNVAMRCK